MPLVVVGFVVYERWTGRAVDGRSLVGEERVEVDDMVDIKTKLRRSEYCKGEDCNVKSCRNRKISNFLAVGTKLWSGSVWKVLA